jgi:hypothetical protein
MDVLVAQQDDMINVIEASAQQVQKDTEAGYVISSFTNNFRLTAVTQPGTNRKGCGACAVSSPKALVLLFPLCPCLGRHRHCGRSHCRKGKEIDARVYSLDVGLFYARFTI